MSLESPLSVLYNSEGYELAVSQSQIVSGSTQPGLLIAASGSDGTARFLKVSSNGDLFVTGSLSIPTVATQSVNVASWNANVTASVREIGGSTTVVSSANGSTTNYTLLNANPNRIGATFFKEGNNIAYLKLGAVASATSYTVRLTNNGYYELPENYTGQVDVVFNTNVGKIHVTEITTP